MLGMEEITFSGRRALAFGIAKINLHEAGYSIQPCADNPVPGSADVCLVLDGSLDDAVADLGTVGIAIVGGRTPLFTGRGQGAFRPA